MNEDNLDEEYEQLPEWLKDTLEEIYDYGINHGGHIWVAFRDIEKAITKNYEEKNND